MQFQADIMDTYVRRPKCVETTALGAAYLAGLGVGFWDSVDELRRQWKIERTFEPNPDSEAIQKARQGWADAVARTLSTKQ